MNYPFWEREMMGKNTQTEGQKFDDGKPQLGRLFSSKLLPAVKTVIKVIEFGAKKYGWNNWSNVDNGAERYREAAIRHLAARTSGELNDPESALPHTAHAVTSALFSLALDFNIGGK